MPSKRITLITPPLLQLNTPYPAVPMLAGYLRAHGHQVTQRDISLETALQIFSPDFIRKTAASLPPSSPFAMRAGEYADTILPVIDFLRGRRPELAWRIASGNFLPEGAYFDSLSPMDDDEANQTYQAELFGTAGLADRARHLASLYMDDLAALFTQHVDKDFGFGKYAEHLSLALRSLDPLLKRLKKTTPIDEVIDRLAESVAADAPDFAGLTVPFPGTLYGALRIARTIRRLSPKTRILLGGGYVNSELRHMRDNRIFDDIDAIMYDDGFIPLQAILEAKLTPSQTQTPGGTARVRTREGLWDVPAGCPDGLQLPDYHGLDLDQYIPLAESPIPMHRIWTDGVWLKLQLSRGCYWHKCAFCDVSLDYIGHYLPARAEEIADGMERLIQETGRCGFHFVDEALAPALLKALCKELLHRKIHAVWWGNIRFDTSFTPELCRLMASAGCIAVTGGLECANDRLLKLMNKGITLASARKAMENLASEGIQVHAYLMYGFPTETYREVASALRFVRDCYADGILHSSFWHRFALTIHSPIAKTPERFGIRIQDDYDSENLFALNEITYSEPGAPDWKKIGRGLETANYNYILGLGLDEPITTFLRQP